MRGQSIETKSQIISYVWQKYVLVLVLVFLSLHHNTGAMVSVFNVCIFTYI